MSVNGYERPQLPPHWKVVRLGDVCFLRAEGVQPSDNPHMLYVGLEHIDSGDPHLTRWGFASEVSSSKSKFYAGDVVYGKLRPYLDKGILAEFEGICSTDILVIRPRECLASEFLAYQIHTGEFLEHATRTMRGVNHPRTSWSSLATFEFPLPPLPEQRAIARTLRAVQDAIQARRREAMLERERKAALTQHLFTHGTRGEARKQTKIGEVPESWQVTRLGEGCEFLQYGTSERCDDDASGIPVLRIPNVIGGKVDTNDLKYINLPQDVIDRLRLAVGDLLFVRTNGRREYTGRCAVFNDELPEPLFASYLIRARLRLEMLLPAFVQLYTMTSKGQEYLSGRASNAADGKFNINTQTIKNALVPLPSLDEQWEIAGVAHSCDAKIAALEHEGAALDELFRAMLEELMAGRLSALPLAGDGAR